ncbi:hypothetical protein [Aestuariirhabdus litorea]|uniref:Uncharacterized protein n=1 Tax=Aestuariirhabdus litorea TaxID=2528527 RepID=A0A3P3VP61_9GAMM|nr:hypothetical protein [Aestuariirhabdus litorea]RRJ83446.1 hypothetical protein D0544_16660 [Aestuariirhabdus litorea]RWW93608.1 hypothetical protein DZC74_16630 [Endozoicomonadaceae bacterium GTF-13]
MGRRLWAVFILVWAGTALAAETNFALYSASSSMDGKPVTLKLDTRNGDSWFFDGVRWQVMEETGSKNRYEEPAYQLKLTDSTQGLVILRFSEVNGSSWIYTAHGWEYIEESTP